MENQKVFLDCNLEDGSACNCKERRQHGFSGELLKFPH